MILSIKNSYQNWRHKASDQQLELKIKRTIGDKMWIFCRAMLLIGLCFVLAYPLIYMISNAFKPVEQNFDTSIVWIPKSLTFQNFIDAMEVLSFKTALTNTLMIGLVTAGLQLISCIHVGYGFARYRFKARGALFFIVLLTIIVPPQFLALPIYTQLRYFDFFGLFRLFQIPPIQIVETYFAFYIPAILGMGLRSGIYIFIFRQFFRSMPKELEDAAAIDGCSAARTFYRVMAPNASGAIITVILFSVVWQWNDFFGPGMLFSTRPTIATSLANFMTNASQIPGIGKVIEDPMQVTTRLQAACLLSVAPLLITYIILQRKFIESVEKTGIVG